MGQIKNRDRKFAWKKCDTQPRDRAFPVPMEKPKRSASEEPPKEASNVRFSDDGFWTTQHPAAKPFSLEWFRTHLGMLPYFWAMIKMALSVNKWSVAVVTLGTVGRAVVDAAQLYAYTRFVNEVYSQRNWKITPKGSEFNRS